MDARYEHEDNEAMVVATEGRGDRKKKDG